MTIRLAAATLACVLITAPAHADVAYQGKAPGYLYVRDADGSDLRRIRAATPPLDPAYSPLGQRIAYGSRGQVWVMNADGSDPRPVTRARAPSRAPTWSPEGDELAFARGRAARQNLYVIGADGFDERRLTSHRADEEAPDWSSRDQIVFVRRTPKGDGDIFVVGPSGGRPQRLTRGRADDGAPAWSRDGRRIAFTRGRPSRRQVYVMRADGSHLRRLTRLPRGVTSPAWSPEGNRIAFGMGRRGRRALHVIRSDGQRPPRRVGSGASDPRSIDWRPSAGAPIVAAAGDIACDPAGERFVGTRRFCRHRQTSDLLLRMELSAVLMLGDAQYSVGTLSNFLLSFHPSWGRVKSLIRPAIGNHEYADPGAAGYFDYFNGAGQPDGPAGPRALGYYSYDLGDWHLVALNSQCDRIDCAQQERWLRADLAANPARCTLAYFHHPLISAGTRGINESVRGLWRALYDAGAEIALTGHDHGYERFAPFDPALNRDGARGVRQFVVGSGGRSHRAVVEPKPNSEVRNDDTYGVLQLQLRPDGYSWTFVPERGGAFTDAGANSCH